MTSAVARDSGFEHQSYLSLLRTAAGEVPEMPLATIAGQTRSYEEALDAVENVARGLRELGMSPGDRVAIMAGNRLETAWAWLGTNAAQAIDVPINAETRGRHLDYVVSDARPRIIVGTEDRLDILARDIHHTPDIVVTIGGTGSQPFGSRCRHISFDALVALGASSALELTAPRPGDTATIMYTSGTTGASKGVMLPQRYYVAHGQVGHRVTQLDRGEVIYCAQPLFHIDARVWVATATAARGALALGARFSVSRFWDEVREHNATVFSSIGTMVWLLYKAPERPEDAAQPARLGICSSTPAEIHRAFEERFGCRVTECYGMTECVFISGSAPGDSVPGRVGVPIDELEVALLDDDDIEVGRGVPGELAYRPGSEFMMMQGYWGKPEATVEAWRNLWFHTGDLLRRDEHGRLEFIGRKKDSIRRRGENVSAWEVEQAVSAHVDVSEVAAIGVPSEVGEEDVAILVVLKDGRSVTAQELVRFIERDLPKFAVPRYVEFVTELPKTPSERIAKGDVRALGITRAAWDAHAALGRR